MKTERSSNYKPFNYGVGALAALTLSIGFAAIVYGGRILPLDPFNLPAWFFGPLGIYTLVYAFAAGKDYSYYSVWGSVMFAIAVSSALYNVISVFVVFGVLMIVIAVIGLLAYRRKRI